MLIQKKIELELRVMPKKIRTLLQLVFGLAAGALPAMAAGPAHPRLILNPDRLAALKASTTTTHRDFWAAARESADQFSRQSIPAMADANNRFRTFGDTMPVLGLVYHLTGERRYAEAADRWLQALVAVPEWKGSANLGRSAWVVGAALLYDWLHDALPEQTRTRVRDRLVAEGDILLREAAYWRLLSNHCLIETSALGMIGLALQGEHARAGEFLERARERAELIIEHAPLDGSWGEGVQYWEYGLGYFLRYLEASKTAGDRDYYPRYDWLKKTGFFPIHFSLPGEPAATVNFSDSGSRDYVAGFLSYLPASVYRNGYFQDYANKTHPTRPYKFSWMDFIAYDPTVRPVDFTTLPAFKHFSDNGFVIMRSSWAPDATVVGFRCGPAPGHRNQADPRRLERKGFGPGHGHPDINSFCLFAYGQWLAIDPGYVRPKWTREHNTILANGLGQAGEGSEWLDYMAFENREPAPAMLRAETNPDFDYVIGDAGNVYVEAAGVVHFRRHLLFLKPDIVVIFDDLASKAGSRLEWLLLARDQATQTGPDQFEIRQEGVRLWVRPFAPADYSASIESRALKASGTDGRVTTLDFAADSAGRTQFLVVLCALPDAAAAPPETRWGEGNLRISHRGKSWDIAVNDPRRVPDPAARLLNATQR